MPRVYYDTTCVPVEDDDGEPATLVVSTPVVVCGPPGSPERRRVPTFLINGVETRKVSATEFETSAGTHWRIRQDQSRPPNYVPDSLRVDSSLRR